MVERLGAALELAREATKRALDQPVVDGVVRIDSERDDGAIVREGLVDAVARMGMPAVSMVGSYSLQEMRQYGLSAQSEWRLPIVSADNLADAAEKIVKAVKEAG